MTSIYFFATSFEAELAIGSGEGGEGGEDGEGGGEEGENDRVGEGVDGEGGSSSAAAAIPVEEGGNEEGLVDDEWKRVPGGPFTAKLLTRSRQPVSSATYRNYGVAVPIDPIDGPLYPGCQLKFPVVAGAPPEGIVCPLPRSWGADTHVLIFKLKLSKAGATEPTVTIASALYREPPRADTDESEDEVNVAVDLSAHEPSLPHPSPVHPTEAVGGEKEAEMVVDEEEVELEAAALAEEGEEEAVVLTDEQIAARLDELHCVWHDESEEQLDGTAETDLDGVVELLKALGADACVLVVPGTTYEIQRSIYGERAFTISSESNEVDDEEEMGEDADAPPPPPPPPPPPVAPRSSSRPSKRKQLFGDNGEFDGPASRFRSAPSSRKASVDPSVEMGVPAYALPGEQVWAMGLRAGVRMRFKAEVVKLRNQFPRIVVKYIATEEDETSRHVLPDVLTAYLHMGDLKERDW